MKEAYSPLPDRAIKAAGSAGPAVGAGLVVVVAACGWLVLRQAKPAPRELPALPAERGPQLEMPAAASVAESPAPLAEPAAAPAAVEAAAGALPSFSNAAPLMKAALDASARPLAASAAWARATPELRWRWPSHVAGFASGAFALKGAAKKLETSRRVAGWFPSAPAGEQVQLSVIGEDGTEAKVYEPELGGFAAQHKVRAGTNAWAALMAAMTGHQASAEELKEAQIAAAREHHQQSIASLMKLHPGVVGVKDVSPEGQMVGDFELTYKDGHKETIRYDPLVFDLRGVGVQTDDRKVLFDLYGYHKTDKVQWMNDVPEGMGILVFDPRGDGKAGGTGAEVFGDRTDLDGAGKATGFANGFEALRGLVEKAAARGVISREVADGGILEGEGLAALERVYGLKIKVGGFNKTPVSLSEAGIKAIALSKAGVRHVQDFDGRQNDILLQEGAVFLRADGTTGHYMNLWLTAKTGGGNFGK